MGAFTPIRVVSKCGIMWALCISHGLKGVAGIKGLTVGVGTTPENTPAGTGIKVPPTSRRILRVAGSRVKLAI